MKCDHVLLIGIAFFLPIAEGAAATGSRQLQCPAEISPADVKIAARAGWQTYAPFSLPLFGAGMSSGPPESEMQLRGEPLDAKGDTTSYRFGGPDEERWLDCRYGRSGEFTMSRRLDDRIRQCVIKLHKQVPGEARRIDIRCD